MSPAVLAFYLTASSADYWSARPLPTGPYEMREVNPVVRAVGLAPAKALQTAGLVLLDSKLKRPWQRWTLRTAYGVMVGVAVRHNLDQRGTLPHH